MELVSCPPGLQGGFTALVLPNLHPAPCLCLLITLLQIYPGGKGEEVPVPQGTWLLEANTISLPLSSPPPLPIFGTGPHILFSRISARQGGLPIPSEGCLITVSPTLHPPGLVPGACIHPALLRLAPGACKQPLLPGDRVAALHLPSPIHPGGSSGSDSQL